MPTPVPKVLLYGVSAQSHPSTRTVGPRELDVENTLSAELHDMRMRASTPTWIPATAFSRCLKCVDVGATALGFEMKG